MRRLLSFSLLVYKFDSWYDKFYSRKKCGKFPEKRIKHEEYITYQRYGRLWKGCVIFDDTDSFEHEIPGVQSPDRISVKYIGLRKIRHSGNNGLYEEQYADLG